MSDMSKHDPGNVYRAARLRAAKYNSIFNSMDTTFEKLYIGRRTLWEIENGIQKPDSNMVLHMSELYNAPELINHYCANDCPLGKSRGFKPVENMRTEGIALNAVYLLQQAEKYSRTLIETARDGVIDQMERPAIEETIAWINQLAHLRDELLIALDRKDQN